MGWTTSGNNNRGSCCAPLVRLEMTIRREHRKLPGRTHLDVLRCRVNTGDPHGQ
jgi:hypothetical protein